METNMYNDYDNECFNYYTTSTFDCRRRSYLISRYTPDASWDYGDTLTITFNIHECCNLSTEEIEALEGKKLIINFYNDRFEVLPFEYEVDGDATIPVFIDYETSIKYFKRGTYHCSIKAVTYDNEDAIETSETLLSMNHCCFYVQ